MQALPIEVHSVLFRPDNRVEITWAEQDDITEHVSMVRSIVFDRDKLSSMVDDLEQAAAELVDEALLLKRNPPDKEKR